MCYFLSLFRNPMAMGFKIKVFGLAFFKKQVGVGETHGLNLLTLFYKHGADAFIGEHFD